ncbi:hypothetical protein EV368DRAFT_80302 [Lentinula lateritia]|nr:hypothetical protein EV368DRAFT_80302 [Lentinula lateritia]
MDQDYPGSEEEWFGVAGSHPYELNGASATSGKEGTVLSRRSYHSHGHPSPREDNYMRHSPSWDPPSGGEPKQGLNPLEVSPSSDPFFLLHWGLHPSFLTLLLPYASGTSQKDPSLAELQPALDVLPGHNTQPSQRGRAHHSDHHQLSHARARTREPSPGPDFGTHLCHSSRSLSPAAHYAPARFDASSLHIGRNHLLAPQALSYPSDTQLADQHVPVRNGRRFRDPRQGEISSSVPAAMLNQVNPLVISALQSGWPVFISLNYFSCRMSEVGESSVSAGGETWDIDDAGQVKFKSKCLKELSFKSISRHDWDSISKNMPRALMDYFVPPGECGIRSELAIKIAQMFKRFFDMLSDQLDFYEADESYVEYAHKIYSFWFSHLELNLCINIFRPLFFDRIWVRNVHCNKRWSVNNADYGDTSSSSSGQASKGKKAQKGSSSSSSATGKPNTNVCHICGSDQHHWSKHEHSGNEFLTKSDSGHWVLKDSKKGVCIGFNGLNGCSREAKGHN